MDFIERLFGVAPDGGDGTFELFLIIVAAVVVTAIVVARVLRRRRRAARARADNVV